MREFCIRLACILVLFGMEMLVYEELAIYVTGSSKHGNVLMILLHLVFQKTIKRAAIAQLLAATLR